jgi:hypothetical protein
MLQEQPEKVTFRRSHETVEQVRILAYNKMSKQPNPVSRARQLIKARERYLDEVSDSLDCDDHLCRQSLDKFAI